MEIEIYADETKFTSSDGKHYMGIGCLFVPISKKIKLAEELSNLRCLNDDSDGKWEWNFNDCKIQCKEHYHKLNNTELHHTDLIHSASNPKKKISVRWLNFLMDNNHKNRELIYFKILYLDLDLLDNDFFDNDEINAYNRFFRTVVKGSLNYFWKDSFISIKNIFHDYADNKRVHDYFPWHLPYKLNKLNSRFSFENENITFLDSNHKKNEDDLIYEANLIQFIDLILGAVTQILFRPSKDSVKIEIDNTIFPLVKRLIKAPKNKNSSYHYYRKQDVSIFPKEKIVKINDLFNNQIKMDGEFHRDIVIKEPMESDINQSSLDKWF